MKLDDFLYAAASHIADSNIRIVNALTENGQTVGFLGDGINDAGAMRAADVGISVDTAVDVAKESADVILLRKDLMVLEKGILSGRRVFTNTMKYVKLTASSNFGNVFSVIPASIFLPFLPIAPIQSLYSVIFLSRSDINLLFFHVFISSSAIQIVYL